MANTPPEGSRNNGSRSFDPQAIRAALRALEFSGLSAATAAEQDYFAFYGIDFANRIPGLNHHFGLTEAAGFQIACHYYQLPAARGTCVLLHGYFDHAGLYGHLIEHCLSSGRNVLIWDLPGHGLSSGQQASIHSFEDYTDVLAIMLDRHGEQLQWPLWAIGQSTGGAVLMSWAFRKCRSPRECPFERMMLLAPLVRPARWRQVKLLHTLLRPLRSNLGRNFVRNSSDDDFLAFVQADPLQSRTLSVRWVSAMRRWVDEFMRHAVTDYAPLVVQGSADDTVDWRWNLPMIRQKFPHADFRMVEGAGHHLANESRALRAEVFAALALDRD
ncbi:MAG: alpha/beta hydrolase [Pseudomonadales bacterium]|nr:alpha/beta hydrolase [Pseudomonadales bacterium]